MPQLLATVDKTLACHRTMQ